MRRLLGFDIVSHKGKGHNRGAVGGRCETHPDEGILQQCRLEDDKASKKTAPPLFRSSGECCNSSGFLCHGNGYLQYEFLVLFG